MGLIKFHFSNDFALFVLKFIFVGIVHFMKVKKF